MHNEPLASNFRRKIVVFDSSHVFREIRIEISNSVTRALQIK